MLCIKQVFVKIERAVLLKFGGVNVISARVLVPAIDRILEFLHIFWFDKFSQKNTTVREKATRYVRDGGGLKITFQQAAGVSLLPGPQRLAGRAWRGREQSAVALDRPGP